MDKAATHQELLFPPEEDGEDSWTRTADLPAARRMSAAAAVDGIIYLFGGMTEDWSDGMLE
jgi:hypothetical protein